MFFEVSDHFTQNLLQWYKLHRRDLPWRNTDSPYKIWLSEVMLQQTRVETVIPYYHRFLDSFPSLEALARADQQEVLKCWEGLGYYSRGRNFHQAAKKVVEDFQGVVPSDYDRMIGLKGVGPYTAAAVLSIAYNKKYAVVDGNVIRVAARYLGIEDDIRAGSVKKQIQEFMDQMIPADRPGDFNQAVMELGATVCKPQQPDCDNCPVATHCAAYNLLKTDVIPYKSKAKKIPHYDIGVGLILNPDNKLLIAMRPENGMLGGLWEFPGGKREEDETLEETVIRELKEELGVDIRVFDKFQTIKHTYSHFKITLHAYWCRITSEEPRPKSSREIKWASLDNIDSFPFPKANKTLIRKLQTLKIRDMSRYLK